MSDVVLVTGVGPGTGKAVVERFAGAGYVVAMLARTEQRLIEIKETLPNTHAFVCDVSNEAELTATLNAVRETLGAPKVVIHNAVGAERGTYAEIDADNMRRAFEINTMALLALAKQVIPDMESAGGGALICTGNTSAYRGRARFAGFADVCRSLYERTIPVHWHLKRRSNTDQTRYPLLKTSQPRFCRSAQNLCPNKSAPIIAFRIGKFYEFLRFSYFLYQYQPTLGKYKRPTIHDITETR